ncbi:fascin domain-containing protein [Nonomuraea sp. NPDC050022]|uniref:fascin domain-containing protein n=1 Tax=Nonomuraea sp. NPDC050022 TaxID=3364358 RepID=UPI0037AD8D4D
MNFRNSFRAFGMTLAAGTVVLAATPAAIADTASTPAAGQCEWVGIISQEMSRAWSTRNSEVGYKEGMLTATAALLGSRETFKLCNLDNTNYVIAALTTKKYVSAELDYSGADYGMLRARSTGVGDWEKFRFECTGSLCAIKSSKNNKYVSAEYAYEGSGYGMLRARADTAGPWEKFYVRPSPNA